MPAQYGVEIGRAFRETLLRRRERLGISYYVFASRLMEPMAPVVDALAGT